MTLSIAPNSPVVAAQAALLDVSLQSGTVVTAQVLTLLDANLVRIAIANLTLDATTNLPLQAGQTLQLAVTQTKDGISLMPIRSDAGTVATSTAPMTSRGAAVVLNDIPLAPKLPAQTDTEHLVLTPVELRAVAIAAQTAVTKQSGLSPLFANLAAAATSGHLPQPVIAAASELFAMRQSSDRAVSGSDLKAALASSGLLLEPSLAAGLSSSGMPDMKAALIVLRQALATWLGESASDAKVSPSYMSAAAPGHATSQLAAPAIVAERSASILAALNEAATAATDVTRSEITNPAQKSSLPPTAAGLMQGRSRDDAAPLSRMINTPPPFRNALPSAQSVAAPTLARDAEPLAIAQQLVADTEGALARQTLLQIASMPDQSLSQRAEATQPRWNFEIPFATPHGTAMAQLEVARDGGGTDIEATRRVWRARFSLNIEPAGPVHALISLSGDTTSVKMWAERSATAAQLRANAAQLGASLDRAALKAGDIIIADGAPMRAQSPSAGHFLNRAS